MTQRRHFPAPLQAMAATCACAMAGFTLFPMPNPGILRSPMRQWTILESVATPLPTAPMPTTQEPVTMLWRDGKHPQLRLHRSTWLCMLAP